MVIIVSKHGTFWKVHTFVTDLRGLKRSRDQRPRRPNRSLKTLLPDRLNWAQIGKLDNFQIFEIEFSVGNVTRHDILHDYKI